MHSHHSRPPLSRNERRSCERRSGGGAHQGVLAAVVALTFCAWVMVVQHGTPELDAATAQQSLEVLDQLLAVDGDGEL